MAYSYECCEEIWYSNKWSSFCKNCHKIMKWESFIQNFYHFECDCGCKPWKSIKKTSTCYSCKKEDIKHSKSARYKCSKCGKQWTKWTYKDKEEKCYRCQTVGTLKKVLPYINKKVYIYQIYV